MSVYRTNGPLVFKVRELSGNFVISRGNFEIKLKVREKSGNFEITSQRKCQGIFR